MAQMAQIAPDGASTGREVRGCEREIASQGPRRACAHRCPLLRLIAMTAIVKMRHGTWLCFRHLFERVPLKLLESGWTDRNNKPKNRTR